MPLNIHDFSYNLPGEKIAAYPLSSRDESKLLVYAHGKVEHHQFSSLPTLLPPDALLFFNNTRVIPARLLFRKDTGAEIEIFLLEPIFPTTLIVEAMQVQRTCDWHCTVGNLKKWKVDTALRKHHGGIHLEAMMVNREKNIVRFSWNSDISFARLISLIGEVPLPPYIKRLPENSDRERYQTVYSQEEGAVAAPTAGLHFTKGVIGALNDKHIETDFLTLHVGAGTFQPIKVDNALDHIMHPEQIIVSRKNLENLLKLKFIVSVGTTSMRSLESLYWFGVKLIHDPKAAFIIQQNDPFISRAKLPSAIESVTAVMKHMDSKQVDHIVGETSIYIVPGYSFRICNGLITNFHQPQSTLILLVAAFIGTDWKKIYTEALREGYRFLSYGDSSLLLP